MIKAENSIIYVFLPFMCLSFPECMYVCYMCIGAHGDQKSTNPLKLDLEVVMNYHVGTGNPILGPLGEQEFLPLNNLFSH